MMATPGRAQTTVGPASKQLRTYSGTAAKYTADGQQTIGTINVEVSPNRVVVAQITIGTTTLKYAGTLTDTSKNRTGTAYVISVDDQFQPVEGAERIPLFVTKGIVFGGSLNRAADGLVFRAERGTVSIN